jgi:hypothetical protein
MSPSEVQRIGFEIAMKGRTGLDSNDPTQKYELKSFAGQFSGLHLVCLMYAAFKSFAPETDIGFDLSKEYEAAQAGGTNGYGRASWKDNKVKQIIAPIQIVLKSWPR